MDSSNPIKHILINLQRQQYNKDTPNVKQIILFVKLSIGKRKVILIEYVDDIIPICDHEEERAKLKTLLAKEFELKDLGTL